MILVLELSVLDQSSVRPRYLLHFKFVLWLFMQKKYQEQVVAKFTIVGLPIFSLGCFITEHVIKLWKTKTIMLVYFYSVHQSVVAAVLGNNSTV